MTQYLYKKEAYDIIGAALTVKRQALGERQKKRTSHARAEAALEPRSKAGTMYVYPVNSLPVHWVPGFIIGGQAGHSRPGHSRLIRTFSH